MDFSHFSAGMLIGGLIGIIIAILIGALVLSVVNRLVNGFWAHYGRAVATVLVVFIINAIINFIIGKVVGPDAFWALLIIGIIVETVIGGFIMNAFVRRPDGSPLGFKRAALVFLVLAILSALLTLGLRPLQESMQGQLPAQAPAS